MGHRARSASKAVTPLPHIPSHSHPYVAFLVCRIERCLRLRRNFVSVTSDIGPELNTTEANATSAVGGKPDIAPLVGWQPLLTLNGHSGGIGRLQRWFTIFGSQIPVALRARTNFFFHLP